jgi:hypothetical protein
MKAIRNEEYMDRSKERMNYLPGTYAKARPGATEMAETYIREWEQARFKKKKAALEEKRPFTICLSRKIGVGALEIADLLGKKIGFRVVDRQIVEHIAAHADLREKTVELFDEKYPGKVKEFLALAFGEKAFIRSDYSRHLFETLFSLAGLGPSIIVGRGAHLLLPRERTSAVRIICSKEYRVQRVARILDADVERARKKLAQIDKEQRDFFKKAYNKKDASPYEFDIVVNCDFLKNPASVAQIIAKAFEEKFETIRSDKR